MPRFALKVEYHGGNFSGWQRQRDLPSVQGALEAALARLDPAGPLVQGAGRTDAGVHATGQVAHCDLARDWAPERLAAALNHHLRPHSVAILAAARVGGDWHARFAAVERQYLYRMVCRRAPMALEAGLVWQRGRRLEAGEMQKAADMLIGRHDFTTFRSSMCQADSPVRSLDELRVEALPLSAGLEVRFHVRARSFLHNQVRSFAGTLERVGAGAWTAADVGAALAAKDRTACGPVAPPHGLYLRRVTYPQDPFASGWEA